VRILKIAIVVVDSEERPHNFTEAIEFARFLRTSAGEAHVPLKVTVGVEAPHETCDSLSKNLESGIEIRRVWPRTLLGSTIQGLWEVAGRIGPALEHGMHYRDGSADLLDSQIWFLFGGAPRNEEGRFAPLVPLRPVVWVEPDTTPIYVAGFMDDSSLKDYLLCLGSVSCALTKYDQIRRDLQVFVGLPPDRIIHLPSLHLNLEELDVSQYRGTQVERRANWVWRPTSDPAADGPWVLSELQRIQEMHGKQLPGRVLLPKKSIDAGLLSLWAEEASAECTRFPAPALEVVTAGHGSGWLSTAFRQFQRARFALHTSLYGIDAKDFFLAASAELTLVSADYPQARHCANEFGVDVLWYRARDSRSFQRAFSQAVESQPSGRTMENLRTGSAAIALNSNWWYEFENNMSQVGFR